MLLFMYFPSVTTAIQYNKYINWEVSGSRRRGSFHSLMHKGIRASGLDSACHSTQHSGRRGIQEGDLYPYHSLRTVNVSSSQFGAVTDSLVVLDDSV